MIPKRDKEAFDIFVESVKQGNVLLIEAKDLQGKQVSVMGIVNHMTDGVGIIPVAVLTPEDLTEVLQPPEGVEVRELTQEAVEFHGNDPDCLGHSIQK